MRTHCLLRIDGAGALCAESALPRWVGAQLTRGPWVVVRRARTRHGLLPVGVRGAARSERFAAWLDPEQVRDCLTPQQLAARRGGCGSPRRARLAALASLDEVAALMARAGLAGAWGVAGSVAFELASGCLAVTAASDLDLIVEPDCPLSPSAAAALLASLAPLAVHADVLLEAPAGAVALAEYARGRPPYLLRTLDGPRLRDDPWAPALAAA